MIDDDRPTKLPVDVYVRLPPHRQLPLVKEQMDFQEKKRRDFLESGRSYADQFRSALRDLNDVLYSRPPQETQTLGAILEEAHAAGRVPATEDRGVPKASLLSMETANRLAPSAAMEKKIKESNVPLAGHMARATKEKAKSVNAMDAGRKTMAANDAVAAARSRRQTNQRVSARFTAACQSARDAMRRRASCPPAASSRRMLEENVQRLLRRSEEAKALEKQVRGMAPREEETRLRDKNKLLEDQVNNQVGLIKGLREKLRLAAAANAQLSEALALVTTELQNRGVTAPAIAGKLLPPPRPALTELGTLVFCDVQSSAHLWETLGSNVMSTQVKIYHEVIRRVRERHNGTEVDRVGDRLQLTFRTAVAATKFAVEAQLELTQADWCVELTENPDTPAEYVRGSTTQYLWHGFRVSMGVYSNCRPELDRLTDTVAYNGENCEAAAVLQLMAEGGEILIGADVHAQCLNVLPASLVVFQGVGQLLTHKSRATVFRAVHATLKDRLHTFKKDLNGMEAHALDMMTEGHLRSLLPKGSREGIHDNYTAPTDGVSIVCVAPENVAALFDEKNNIPLKVRQQALNSFCETVERTKGPRGYVSRKFHHCYEIVYQNATDAAVFALKLQLRLLEVEWPDILMLAEFASARVKGQLVFNGIRARVGMHVVETTQKRIDPMYGTARFGGKGTDFASVLASVAKGGEILVTATALNVFSENVVLLDHPCFDAACGIPLPGYDAISTAFQVFPQALKLRGPYLVREHKLPDEPADDRTEAIDTLVKQLATVQDTLEAKCKYIARLEKRADDKSAVIRDIRKEVLGKGFPTVDVAVELQKLETNMYFETKTLLCIGIAHAQDLVEVWPDEMSEFVDIMDEFIQEFLPTYRGVELRRVPSGMVRILMFDDQVTAVEFWLTVARQSMHLKWPDKLAASDKAGVVMLSDMPHAGHIAHGLDDVVWRGLRPVAGLVHGRPECSLNPCTRMMVASGAVVNDCVSLMLRARDGECYAPVAMHEDLQVRCDEKVDMVSVDALPAIGVCRIVPTDPQLVGRYEDAKRYNTQLSGEEAQPVLQKHVVRRDKGFLVHIVMQSTPVLSDSTEFFADKALFHTCVRKVIAEYDGSVVTSTDNEYLAGFHDFSKGAEFSLHIHVALLAQQWSERLLRLPEYAPRSVGHGRVMGGILVACGAHTIPDIALSVDLVAGQDVWVHKEVALAYMLAREAHFGETLASSDAKSIIEAISGARHATYCECSGDILMLQEKATANAWTCLPHGLKGRLALFLYDDAQRCTTESLERFNRREQRRGLRREFLAKEMALERGACQAMEPMIPSIHKPAPERNRMLFKNIRAVARNCHFKKRTAENTMALLETVAMMSEDPLYQTEKMVELNTPPQHQALLFHTLHHYPACQSLHFNRSLANRLMMEGAPMDADGNPVDDEDDSSRAASRASKRRGSRRASVAASADKHGVTMSDVVRVHVDVERFATLISVTGVEPGAGVDGNKALVESWVRPLFPVVCPDDEPSTETAEKVGLMTENARSLTVDDVDTTELDDVYASLIGHLTTALHRICQ